MWSSGSERSRGASSSTSSRPLSSIRGWVSNRLELSSLHIPGGQRRQGMPWSREQRTLCVRGPRSNNCLLAGVHARHRLHAVPRRNEAGLRGSELFQPAAPGCPDARQRASPRGDLGREQQGEPRPAHAADDHREAEDGARDALDGGSYCCQADAPTQRDRPGRQPAVRLRHARERVHGVGRGHVVDATVTRRVRARTTTRRACARRSVRPARAPAFVEEQPGGPVPSPPL